MMMETLIQEQEQSEIGVTRDVSGLLVLNCGKSKKIRKAYVELEIKLEINFADTISYSDYEKAKTDFYSRQKHSDDYNQLDEEITVN